MKLIQEVDFKPLDALVVTFEKYRTFSTDYTVLDKEANEGKDPLKDEMVTKIVKKQVKYNTQVAVVVAVPEKDEAKFAVGDQVMVDFRGCMELDGYKDLWLIPTYKIIGKKI
jgi:hypothetical protein